MVEQGQEWEISGNPEYDPFGYLWNLVPGLEGSMMVAARRGKILIERDAGHWEHLHEGYRRLPPTVRVSLFYRRGYRRREAYLIESAGLIGEIHEDNFTPLISTHLKQPSVSGDFQGNNRLRFDQAIKVAQFVKLNAILP